MCGVSILIIYYSRYNIRLLQDFSCNYVCAVLQKIVTDVFIFCDFPKKSLMVESIQLCSHFISNKMIVLFG